MDEANDLVETGGEKAEGDCSREKLEDTQDVLKGWGGAEALRKKTHGQ